MSFTRGPSCPYQIWRERLEFRRAVHCCSSNARTVLAAPSTEVYLYVPAGYAAHLIRSPSAPLPPFTKTTLSFSILCVPVHITKTPSSVTERMLPLMDHASTAGLSRGLSYRGWGWGLGAGCSLQYFFLSSICFCRASSCCIKNAFSLAVRSEEYEAAFSAS